MPARSAQTARCVPMHALQETGIETQFRNGQVAARVNTVGVVKQQPLIGSMDLRSKNRGQSELVEVLDVTRDPVGIHFAAHIEHGAVVDLAPELAATSSLVHRRFSSTETRGAGMTLMISPLCVRRTAIKRLQLTRSGTIDPAGAVGSGWEVGLATVESGTDDVKRKQDPSGVKVHCLAFSCRWVPARLRMTSVESNYRAGYRSGRKAGESHSRG